jgi:acyl-CoA thioester hydrolase
MSESAAQGHQIDIRIYYEDTDFTGMVYHGNIVNFFERGRTEFFRALGSHHAELIDAGYYFVVRRLQVDYRAGAHIDDLVQVTTKLQDAAGARLDFDQTIMRGDTLIAEAKVCVGFVSRAGRPRRLTPEILARLAPHLER